MGQAQPKRTVLIVEDDSELRNMTAALLEESEELDTIECESAEAALAVMPDRRKARRHDLPRRAASRRLGWDRSCVGGESASG
jgi:DNA-binding NtrC family response regulator